MLTDRIESNSGVRLEDFSYETEKNDRFSFLLSLGSIELLGVYWKMSIVPGVGSLRVSAVFLDDEGCGGWRGQGGSESTEADFFHAGWCESIATVDDGRGLMGFGLVMEQELCVRSRATRFCGKGCWSNSSAGALKPVFWTLFSRCAPVKSRWLGKIFDRAWLANLFISELFDRKILCRWWTLICWLILMETVVFRFFPPSSSRSVPRHSRPLGLPKQKLAEGGRAIRIQNYWTKPNSNRKWMSCGDAKREKGKTWKSMGETHMWWMDDRRKTGEWGGAKQVMGSLLTSVRTDIGPRWKSYFCYLEHSEKYGY